MKIIKIDPNSISGLSEKEAREMLKFDGYNELPSEKKRSNFLILLKIFSEPMFILLAVSGLLYFFIGEIKDAIMLFSMVFVVIGITFYQERKTENTLEALRRLSSPRVLVIRDGKRKRIAGREVVRGDIVVLQEGDRVPADATVLFCQNLSIDESFLTGESVPVRKIEWDEKLKIQRPGGDDLPFVYSGSMVVNGHGIARVDSTGPFTEIGKIGKSLGVIKEEDTLLHKETTRIVRFVAVAGLFSCVLVAVLYAILKDDLMGGLLAGLTLSMAMLPEEFPMVLLIFLTIGAYKISKRKVLTRKSATIETLGAATVLCADKTGTLTLNKMELVSLYTGNSFCEINNLKRDSLPEKFRTLLQYGILASQKDPFDPIEKELKKIGGFYIESNNYLCDTCDMVKEYSLTTKISAISRVWKLPNKKEFFVASKGSPESILSLCNIKGDEKERIIQRVQEMSDKGLRVLGVAKAVFLGENLPKDQRGFDFEFVGLLGFVDLPRTSAISAIKEAHSAGIRVIMITGDYPGTAQFVARKIGLKNSENYITGEELEKMNHLDLREKIKTVNIFARVFPEQKLLIVNALKANNEIVAMTGDGVNDAPALKAAHIGIAMGERGTDVAREASSLVLLNDDFSSIVVAVRLGRIIFDNLKKAMSYLLAVHVPIAGMSLLPLLFNFPIVLFPAHIAFLELIIDPACSIVFESVKGESGIMGKPPRDLRRPMFDKKMITISILQGLGVLVAVFALFVFATKSGREESEVRSLAFASLILANLMLITVNLSWSKSIRQIFLSANKTFFAIFISALTCLILVLYVPFLADLFHLSPLHAIDFLIVGLTVLVGLVWFEILKVFKVGLN